MSASMRLTMMMSIIKKMIITAIQEIKNKENHYQLITDSHLRVTKNIYTVKKSFITGFNYRDKDEINYDSLISLSNLFI